MNISAFVRGATLRCPTCGVAGIFSGYFTLRERCPGCGLRFEREEGYWLGAMVVAIGVTEALFGLWLVVGMILTWPDVAWTALLIGGLALNLVIPIGCYPWAKTTWMGIHHAFVPPDASEQADAITAHEAAREEPAADQRAGS